MTTTIAPDEALLGAVADQVWSSMLHGPVLPWPSAWAPGRAGVQAAITVAGDWDGSLRLWCADAAAVSMTRALLRLTTGADPDREDVEDAVGELVNVVAGSLKGALGGTSGLGLPAVSGAPAPTPEPAGLHLAVAWHDDPVLVSILPAP